MNQITKQVLSLYKYYSKGATKDIPHFKLLTSLVLLTVIVIYVIIILMDANDIIFTSNKDNSEAKWFFLFILKVAPIYLLYNFLFSKKKLDNMAISDEEILKRNKINLVIIILAIIAVPALLIFKFGVGK